MDSNTERQEKEHESLQKEKSNGPGMMDTFYKSHQTEGRIHGTNKAWHPMALRTVTAWPPEMDESPGEIPRYRQRETRETKFPLELRSSEIKTSRTY